MRCTCPAYLALLLVIGGGAALMAGCGSVGEVGYGASRAGVEPVHGTYGYGLTPYGQMDASRQAERVRLLARPNQRAEKKTASLMNKAKALPDEDGVEIGEIEIPTQPTLDAQTKLLVKQHDTYLPATERMALGPQPDAFEE